MKRALSVMAIVVLVGAVAMPAWAHGPGWGRGGYGMGPGGGPDYCPRYGNSAGGWNDGLTEEQRAQLDKLYQKFTDETASMRSDLWNKRGELNTLLNSPNPDAEKAKALQKEISDLRSKMAEKKLDLRLEEGKIALDKGLAKGYGRGYGPHMRGYYGPHMGYGPGMMGNGRGMMGNGPGISRRGPQGGYGPGNCWN
jgi:zinc resistance-associated protein